MTRKYSGEVSWKRLGSRGEHI